MNYNGKFKEKYSIIYEDKEKINNLIINNAFTKNIAGEKLHFLKNGKYLIYYDKKLNYKGSGVYYLGKDLTTDKLVSIGVYDYWESYDDEVNILKKLGKINNSCNYIDHFETKSARYIVKSLYDECLGQYFYENNINKGYFVKLPPNLIKKIFTQINIVFKELNNNNLVYGVFSPLSILIKFINEDKTNFDSFLTEYWLTKEFNPNLEVRGEAFFKPPEEKVHKNSSLYSIGLTIIYFYFGDYIEDEKIINYLSDQKKANKCIPINEDKQLEDLLNKLIVENPDERITLEEYLEHPFFKQYEY